MTDAELANRFGYHTPDAERATRHALIREQVHELADQLNQAIPESREASLAFTHLEQVMFYANAAIARERCSECSVPLDSLHRPECSRGSA